MIVALVLVSSFFIPNLNVLLAIGGSVLGTLVTIVIPIMFYNKAYSDDDLKNAEKDLSGESKKESRKTIMRFNSLILFIGVFISGCGFISTIEDLFYPKGALPVQ
mmetsp:Transcript_17683/g.29891  ORF Transcript_17683/g.29891 Transcript_17683/m.29891 type:complete len:105 (+) Transcript_17683:1452-1766(+)